MFLAVNIFFIIIVIRLSLNSNFLNAVLSYNWKFLLKFQHLFFLLTFAFIALATANNRLNPPNLYYYVSFLVLFNSGVYYLVNEFIVPRYYLSNKYPIFILHALFVFLVSSLFRILLEPTIFGISIDNNFTFSNYIYIVYSFQAFVILIATFLGITKGKFIIEKDYKELGEKKEQIQFNLIKSKLSPHFLLNTLNNIYVNSYTSEKKTSESILSLSKLLQFVIYDTSSDKISLSNEFSTMLSFDGLYRLRYNNNLNIIYDLKNEEDWDNIDIPPAIYLTIFENAIKHSGIGMERDSFIEVSFKREGTTICFEVRNSIVKKVATVESGYEGLGINSLAQILMKYYDGRFSFVSQAVSPMVYLTTLKIDL